MLVETSHPGNIGGVARAMKNMGLSRLYLVSPKIFPSAHATARAVGADDILGRAILCNSLGDAIKDCHFVVGTSVRSRSIPSPVLTARECADLVCRTSSEVNVAIVFGREQSGLTNAELDRCQYWLKIPCNPAFNSLNLAAAVQVVAYELYIASVGSNSKNSELNLLASAEQLESFYGHLYEVLSHLGFIHQAKSLSIMRRLRRIFNRVRLETTEIDILRGVLSAAQGKKMPRKPN